MNINHNPHIKIVVASPGQINIVNPGFTISVSYIVTADLCILYLYREKKFITKTLFI